MAEALILSVIQKMDILYVEAIELVDIELVESQGWVIDELRMILDFLRDKNLGDDRLGKRLNYLICDAIEVALYLNYAEDIDVDEEYEYVRNSLREIKKRMLELGVGGEETESENVGEGENEDEDVVPVGLEEQVKLLMRRAIFNEEKCFSTSMITGMVGIGKTTLARHLYNHVDVVDKFERRAWVCTTDLTQKALLIKLIQQVVDCEELQRDSLLLEKMDNRSLQRMLHQTLQGMRYFIVLDDLSKQIYLRSFLKALPLEDKGSRLVLTSRSKDIDTSVHYTHLIEPLDYDKSWQLFLKTVLCGDEFTSEHKFPKHLEDKRREMLRKCGGLPLQIKAVGRQLAKKRQSGCRWDWEELLESIDFGAPLESLELFYIKFDPMLKPCFLHLAFFKENSTMSPRKLWHILATGGMVSASKLESLVGYLYSESIIEIKEMGSFYGARSFYTNIVLHRLSTKKAEEEIGFEILSNNGNNRPSESPRHRVIKCSRDKFNYSTDQDKHLVSLFFHGGGYLDATPSYWKSFEQRLRILDLDDFGLKSLPESIGTLMELGYLGLRNNYLKELPQSLGCLKNLEVLDIAQNFMVEMPDIIWEISSLRYLYMSDVIFWKPLKIDALQFLEILTYISVDNLTYELSGLKTMTCLKKLGVEKLDGNSDVSKLFVSLAELEDLQYLILRGYRFISMPFLDELCDLHRLNKLRLDGILPRLPSFPSDIRCLKLVNSSLDEDPMPVLEKLHWLSHLNLRNAFTGQEMVISHDGFPDLEVLCIEEMWNLKNVQIEKGGMSSLEKLEIKNCPSLESLPEEIGSMTLLKELKMVTTKSIATIIRRSDVISKIVDVDINP